MFLHVMHGGRHFEALGSVVLLQHTRNFFLVLTKQRNTSMNAERRYHTLADGCHQSGPAGFTKSRARPPFRRDGFDVLVTYVFMIWVPRNGSSMHHPLEAVATHENKILSSSSIRVIIDQSPRCLRLSHILKPSLILLVHQVGLISAIGISILHCGIVGSEVNSPV